jgi:hypothetical protein
MSASKRTAPQWQLPLKVLIIIISQDRSRRPLLADSVRVAKHRIAKRVSERRRRARLCALSRLEKLANLVLVTGIAHAADLEYLTVGELERETLARIRNGAGAARFAKPPADFRGVLLHITAQIRHVSIAMILRHCGR